MLCLETFVLGNNDYRDPSAFNMIDNDWVCVQMICQNNYNVDDFVDCACVTLMIGYWQKQKITMTSTSSLLMKMDLYDLCYVQNAQNESGTMY